MSEIKVRAWDTRRNKMWPAEQMGKDQLTLSPDGKGFINVSGASTKLSTYLAHLIPEQFTGLYDKNGREIYEGDILKTEEEALPIVKVTWQKGHYAAGGILGAGDFDGSGVEVIGDIHTTPKLLERKE